MFKWLGLAASFLIGRMNHPAKASGFNFNIKDVSMEVFSGITQRGRRYVTLGLLGFGSMLLACAGILIGILNATTQYDTTGRVLFTSTFGAGVFMTLIAAGTFTWVFMKEWPRTQHVKAKVEVKQEPRVAPVTGLESALSALIMDFVQEREWKRQQHFARNESVRPERHQRERPEEGTSEVRH
jgi:hypothetical protein